jgi:hypothetical protein
LPPGRIKIVSATVDGDPYTDFDANALSVKLPKWTSPELLTVTLAPK